MRYRVTYRNRRQPEMRGEALVEAPDPDYAMAVLLKRFIRDLFAFHAEVRRQNPALAASATEDDLREEASHTLEIVSIQEVEP